MHLSLNKIKILIKIKIILINAFLTTKKKLIFLVTEICRSGGSKFF